MRQSRLDGVEPRPLKASNQVRVVASHRHDGIVPVQSAATEGNRPDKTPATDCNSTSGAFRPDLVAAVDLAAARCGLTDKSMAAAMGISAGTWSKQKNGVDGHHIQLDRLAQLPEAFHVEFARIYGGLVGLEMAHQTIADLLVARVGQLLVECNGLYAQVEAIVSRRRTA